MLIWKSILNVIAPILTIGLLAFTVEAKECSELRYREDREACYRDQEEAAERARAREEAKAREAEKQRQLERQREQEQKRKSERAEEYKIILNALVQHSKGPQRKYLHDLLRFDSNLSFESCINAQERFVFGDVFENSLKGIKGGFTPSDYQYLLAGVILLPNADGSRFSDGSEYKSVLGEIRSNWENRELPRVQNVKDKQDRSADLKLILGRLETSARSITNASGNSNKYLPKTQDERDSYMAQLAKIEEFIGGGSDYVAIDTKWAETFFDQVTQGKLNPRTCNLFSRYFEQYRPSFGVKGLWEGMEPVVANYHFYLFKYIKFQKCSSPTEAATAAFHKAEFESFVKAQVYSDALKDAIMVGRLRIIADLEKKSGRNDPEAALNYIRACLQDQTRVLDNLR